MLAKGSQYPGSSETAPPLPPVGLPVRPPNSAGWCSSMWVLPGSSITGVAEAPALQYDLAVGLLASGGDGSSLGWVDAASAAPTPEVRGAPRDTTGVAALPGVVGDLGPVPVGENSSGSASRRWAPRGTVAARMSAARRRRARSKAKIARASRAAPTMLPMAMPAMAPPERVGDGGASG